jgi:tetratricopeptide (TPR) repeat protein
MADFDKVSSLALDAIKSDPADYNGYFLAANANMYKRKFHEAEKYITEGKRLFPGNSAFETLFITNKFYSGNYDQVIQSVKYFLLKDSAGVSENLLSLLSIAYFNKGNRVESNTILRQLKEKPENKNSGINYCIARIYSQYHMKDSCFRSLEKSFINREEMFKLFKIDPLFDFIRQDQRYLQLYNRFGFDRYK